MGKQDFTGRVNISAGRSRRVLPQTVDIGEAEPWEPGQSSVTSQSEVIPAMRPIAMVTTRDGEQRPDARRETPVVVDEAAIGEFLKKPVPASVVEAKYGLRAGYLGRALRRRYGDVGTLKRALQGSLLESSLVLVEHAMLNVEEMTPAQAILGAKIAVDASVTLEKSMREAPKTIDFGQLAELGEGLGRIQAFITGSGEGLGNLEITSEDERISRD